MIIGEVINSLARPAIEVEGVIPNQEIMMMMTKCWAELPEERPDFTAIR